MSKSLAKKLRLLAIVAIGVLGFALRAQAADNRLSIADVSILPGETAKIAVNLSNSSPCYGLQFDISLPDGLSLIGVDKSARTSSCMLTPNLTAGKEKVVLLSLSSPLAGNEGDICELSVKASDSFRGGSLKLTGIKMSDGGNTDLVLPDAQNRILTLKSAKLSLPNFAITAGETKTVEIGLSADGNVAALQFDLYLPANLTADLSSFSLSGNVPALCLTSNSIPDIFVS